MSILARLAQRLLAADSAVTYRTNLARARRVLRRFTPPYRVNLGCGTTHFDGWVNVDLETGPAVDLVWDLTHTLPFPTGSCEVIHSEHVMEHIALPKAVALLRECRRVLQPGGVLRIGMPLVSESVRRYYEDDWRDQPWMIRLGYRIETRAEMINICFREWGHQWLYDQEELARRLREAGFTEIRPVAWGESEHSALRGRETRHETLLLCEAWKTA